MDETTRENLVGVSRFHVGSEGRRTVRSGLGSRLDRKRL